MKCSICSQRLLPGSDRCPVCGFRVPHSSFPAPEAPPASRPTRSRSRRGGCILPLALLILLPFLLRLLGSLTFLESTHTAVPEPIASAPFRETPAVPPASEGCFAIAGGELRFLADEWDGGPILSIPDTVDGQAVTALGPGCFRGCTELTTIILPETLVHIGDEAFSGCSGLRGLYLPVGMESIGKDAFTGCTDLEAICIPASVCSISPGCFDDCASLFYIIYEGSFEHWNELYDDYINPFTAAVCLDGTYYHGTPD